MKKAILHIHRIAAISAFLMIVTFFSSTLLVELFGDHQAVLTVKTAILYAIWILMPTMAITGITGAKLAPNANSGPVAKKKKRMPVIAMNGLLILFPAAIYLQHLASIGQFDVIFYSVQAIELLAGLANVTLMALNIRDGLNMKRAKLAFMATKINN